MYVRGLRDRIPTNVRRRASKAGFQEPDWYAGPLVEDDPSSPDFRPPPSEAQGAKEELDLRKALRRKVHKAEAARQMSAKRPSLFSRLRLRWGVAREADAR